MNNTYGIVRPVVLNNIVNDVSIFYNYQSSRLEEENPVNGDSNGKFIEYKNPENILIPSVYDSDEKENSILAGMFNLRLPLSEFGRKGFYTIYIKPREYECTIKDIGCLSAYPDVKGIILDDFSIDERLKNQLKNDNLVGYRIEYYDNNGKRQEYYRIITSNNMCEPVSQNLTSANTTSNGYRFNNNGSLCFITVSPSTSPSYKANAKPYIGVPNQKIILSNTKFDPIRIEVNMVEHDIETLSIMAEGNQVRNLEKGTVTTYNFDNEIYKQHEFFTLKDNYNKNNVFEVKRMKNDITESDLDISDLDNNISGK